LNTDLGKIATEMRHATPDYFLNVPRFSNAMRKAGRRAALEDGADFVEGVHQGKGRVVRRQEGKSRVGDGFRLGLANRLVFPTNSKKDDRRVNCGALICGSRR